MAGMEPRTLHVASDMHAVASSSPQQLREGGQLNPSTTVHPHFCNTSPQNKCVLDWWGGRAPRDEYTRFLFTLKMSPAPLLQTLPWDISKAGNWGTNKLNLSTPCKNDNFHPESSKSAPSPEMGFPTFLVSQKAALTAHQPGPPSHENSSGSADKEANNTCSRFPEQAP